MKVIPLLFIFIILSGCTNRMVYDLIQSNNQSKCQTLPPGQYDACMEENNQSFDEYEKKRKETKVSES
jgi:hypothetical protein